MLFITAVVLVAAQVAPAAAAVVTAVVLLQYGSTHKKYHRKKPNPRSCGLNRRGAIRNCSGKKSIKYRASSDKKEGVMGLSMGKKNAGLLSVRYTRIHPDQRTIPSVHTVQISIDKYYNCTDCTKTTPAPRIVSKLRRGVHYARDYGCRHFLQQAAISTTCRRPP